MESTASLLGNGLYTGPAFSPLATEGGALALKNLAIVQETRFDP